MKTSRFGQQTSVIVTTVCIKRIFWNFPFLKRFYLSYEKCLPFEMAKFFPSANGKNFGSKCKIFWTFQAQIGSKYCMEVKMSNHHNQSISLNQEIIIFVNNHALVFVTHFIIYCSFYIKKIHCKQKNQRHLVWVFSHLP